MLNPTRNKNSIPGIRDAGHTNKLPSPIEEINQDEFCNLLVCMSVIDYTHHMVSDFESFFASGSVFWSETAALMLLQSKGNLRYFYVGCRHKHNTQRYLRYQLTRYECVNCGYERDVDSSD